MNRTFHCVVESLSSVKPIDQKWRTAALMNWGAICTKSSQIKGWDTFADVRVCAYVRACARAFACGCMKPRGNGGASSLSLDKGTNGACGCCGNLCLNVAAQGSSFLHTSHTCAPALPLLQPVEREHVSRIIKMNSSRESLFLLYKN